MDDFRLQQQPQKVTIPKFVAVQLEVSDFVGGTMAAMSFMYKGLQTIVRSGTTSLGWQPVCF
jgi:hypothetical protein